MARGCHKSLSILRAYSSALSHQVRSPLSVIVSDVSALDGQMEAPAVARALSKCEQIVSILHHATPPEVTNVALSKDLTAIVQGAFAAHPVAGCNSNTHVDSRFVVPALDLLARELSRLSLVYSVELSDSVLRIFLRCDFCGDRGQIETFSELFSDSFGIDSVTFPLVDALLMSAGAALAVSEVAGRCVVEVKFGKSSGEQSGIAD